MDLSQPSSVNREEIELSESSLLQMKNTKEARMDLSNPISVNWEEIELSESYLVCCMFEDALSLASTLLRRLSKLQSTDSMENNEFNDMLESAGMVFIQSTKELGRASEMLDELKDLLGSVTAIPVSVLLTGSCLQISDGCTSGLRVILEEFLGKWKYTADPSCYILKNLEQERTYGSYRWSNSLGVDDYLKVAELYAVTLLGKLLNNIYLASSWLEKSDLPEEIRQEMLRRLSSLCSPASNSSLDSGSLQHVKKMSDYSISGTDFASYGGEGTSITVDNKKHTVLRSLYPSLDCFFKLLNPLFLWFQKITLKLGKARFVIFHGRIILWGPLIFMICYVLRKKSAILKRTASRQASALRKALIDLWQLAFSVQVNPLAAVQPLPVAMHGSR